MTTTAKTQKTSDDSAERIRELNEQILDAGRGAGNAYLDAYETALGSIADYQQQAAKQTDVDWLSTLLDTQARFTREITKVYTSTARGFLK
jgi:hypothetical protein